MSEDVCLIVSDIVGLLVSDGICLLVPSSDAGCLLVVDNDVDSGSSAMVCLMTRVI